MPPGKLKTQISFKKAESQTENISAQTNLGGLSEVGKHWGGKTKPS